MNPWDAMPPRVPFKRFLRTQFLINRSDDLVMWTESVDVVSPPAAAAAAETEHP